MKRYGIEKRSKGGETVYFLTDLATSSEVRIVPGIGNQILQYVYRGQSFILPPPNLETLRTSGSKYGVPLLFPPNRVRNGTYTFNEKKYQLPMNNGSHHIHGEIGTRPWTVSDFGTNDEHGAYLTSLFHIQFHPDLAAYYPHDLIFKIKYSLNEGYLHMEGKVTNCGHEVAPYALGFHPYFTLPFENKENTTIVVPAANEWEMEGDFVCGLPKETDLAKRLRLGIPFSEVSPAGYRLFGLEKGTNHCEIHDPSRSYKLIYAVDGHFPYLALFKPKWASAISLEPYTCVTDAFNLPWAASVTGAAGLAAGMTNSFEWQIRIERI